MMPVTPQPTRGLVFALALFLATVATALPNSPLDVKPAKPPLSVVPHANLLDIQPVFQVTHVNIG